MKKTDKKIFEISVASAGMIQSAVIVNHLARMGQTDEVTFNTSIESIYRIEAPDVGAVYGDLTGLRFGFQALINLLSSSQSNKNKDVVRYLMGLIQLERKLAKDVEVRHQLARRIKHALAQAKYFASSPQSIVAGLANIYVGTLGTLAFRLPILGKANYLNQPIIVSKIQAVLLAGVRSAVLWRQVGGTRWQFFLMRNQLISVSKSLLSRYSVINQPKNFFL